MNYLIMCKERSDGIISWWGPNETGYTTDVMDAGRYAKAKAESIERLSMGLAVPVPESAIEKMSLRVIVDLGDGDNFTVIDSLKDRK